jgi:integrase
MAKMTVQEIDALRAKDTTYKKNVDTGLQIRVAANGVKTWIIQYMAAGKQREYRLPRLYGKTTDDGHLSLKDARAEAEKIRALARDGIDYQVHLLQERQAAAVRAATEKAAEEARRRRDEVENLTVANLFTAWVTDGVRRKDGNAELRRSYAKDVLPELGDLPVRQVTEHDVRRMLRTLVDRGVNRSAVVTCANLTQMFLWAEKRQPWRKLLSDGNPVELIDITKIVSPDYDISNQRDRVLSGEEIAELYLIFNEMRVRYDLADNKRIAPRPIAATTELAIWIMLSTICRVGELSKARWEHVRLDEAEWFVPREDTKGSKGKQSDLMVYLSPFALHQFRQLHALTGDSPWCFPATNKDTHVCVKSISKQVGDRQIIFKKDRNGAPRTPIKNRSKDGNALVLSNGKRGEWTPHDLRRTGATMMQSAGVPLEIIDRCQNHILPGSKTRRHYLHYDYANEKRNAWRLLGDRLEQLTWHAGINVVSLPLKS